MKDEIPPFDPNDVCYCERHEMHWIPAKGLREEVARCPWCRIDEMEDFLDGLGWGRDT